MSEKLVEIKDLEISFGEGKKKFVAVKNANFFINRGETFSLVGESGSGKTTIGRAIIGLNDTSKGDIIFDGKKINGKKSRQESAEIIRKIQMIFQDPAASLNERATVDYIISEGLYNYHLFENEEERVQKVKNIIQEVGLLAEHLTRYPHEFSGGQRVISVVAGVLVYAAVHMIGLSANHELATLGLIILTSMTFMALVTALVTWDNKLGAFAALILLLLQLASSAGTYPIELTNKIFQTMNPLLPMSYSVSGLRQTISMGGQIGGQVSFLIVVLLLFMVAGALAYRTDNKKS